METSDSRIVISGASEKSLSFAVRWAMFGKFEMGNLHSSFLIGAKLSFTIKGGRYASRANSAVLEGNASMNLYEICCAFL